ncbi:hypothetical protein ACP70R_037768 [Stipagrostis hirtigluma subsp. patula]
MESEGRGEHSGDIANWPPAHSDFVLKYLANLVVSGTRTSSTFKKVHYNACAKAVNEHFKTNLIGDQIKNHMRKWQRLYKKINSLRKISAAGWDENNYIITLDHEHYTNYVKENKSNAANAEYLNKPLEHYGELLTIYGNSMATGKYAKGSNEALGIQDAETDDTEDCDVLFAATTSVSAAGNSMSGAAAAATNEDNGATSSAPKPKKAKTSHPEGDGLVGALMTVGDMLSVAIERAGVGDNYVPPNLLGTLRSLPGFNETHIAYYHSHLVDYPHKARAFCDLPFDHKVMWFAKFISEKFPGN